MTVGRFWAGTLHSVEPGNGRLYVRKQVVFASDYDALRADNEELKFRIGARDEELKVIRSEVEALRKRLAEAAVTEANLHKRINEWAVHCEGVEKRLAEVEALLPEAKGLLDSQAASGTTEWERAAAKTVARIDAKLEEPK